MTEVINVCFHGVGFPERTLEPGEARYWVSHDSFLRILDELATRSDVRISFDDGNASDAALALPALQERGLSATFFVLAGRLGHSGSLGPGDLRHLVSAGMAVGSHGLHHRPWPGLSLPDLRAELVDARTEIAEVTGRPVTEAACPLGRYDRRVIRELRAQGYRHVFTSDRARARAQAWLQPRFSITSTDSVDSVRRGLLSPPTMARRIERTVTRTAKMLR